MEYEILNKLIPPRKVFEHPNTPQRKLMALHRTLEDLRALRTADANAAPELLAEIKKQVSFYEQILE